MGLLNKDKYIHFHFIPTNFCNENCPYCINSNKKFKEIDFKLYLEFLKKLKELENEYKIILEFNGGEFTLSKNLYKYFGELQNIKIERLILTTHFGSDNDIYKNILNYIDLSKIKLEFFITFHYNRDLNFLKKIEEFLNSDSNFIFTLNLIKGLPLIENNWEKYFKKIEELEKQDKRFKINYSEYIQKSNIDNGKTYNYSDKKICTGGIYYFFNNKISDACRPKHYDIKTFKPNHSIIYCNKTCPNQKFSLEIFKPKILNKRKSKK